MQCSTESKQNNQGTENEQHTHRARTARWLRGSGTEIGAFTHPVEGITPIYVDKFAEFGSQPCLADYQGDAVALPFYDNSLDYVVASHVLEHVANPVRALVEWYRVVKPGGMIYLVVPDKRYTFDLRRAKTEVTHFFDDYARDVDDRDATHVEDYVTNLNWDVVLQDVDPARRETVRLQCCEEHRASARAGREHNIHFHVFVPENVRGLLDELKRHPATRLRWDLVDFAERFPKERGDGILAVLRVRKTWRERLACGWAARWQKRPTFPLLPTAKKFSPHAGGREKVED